MTSHETMLRVVVDRREGKNLVLTTDNGRNYEVAARLLPPEAATEGAVLDVPVRGGKPVWESASRNRPEEEARRTKAADLLKDLRKRDPGGDIEL